MLVMVDFALSVIVDVMMFSLQRRELKYPIISYRIYRVWDMQVVDTFLVAAIGCGFAVVGKVCSYNV